MKNSKWATLGLILTFSLVFSGCKPESADILEIADMAESVSDQSSNLQEVVQQNPSLPLSSEVYFNEVHGDDGLGILFGSNGDVESVLINTNSGNEIWASRTGNNQILPVGDGNQIGDSYARFDLQNHIFYENDGSAEIQIEVEYLDAGLDEFTLEYDSIQNGQDNDQFLKSTDFIKKTDSGEIKTVSFFLLDAYMGNRLENGGDFQINDLGDGSETITKVIVRVYGGEKAPTEVAEVIEVDVVDVDDAVVEGWAVLAEKDDFSDVEMSNMLVDYIDIELLKDLLVASGWDPDHIHEAREFDRDSLQVELDWLESVADENDIVFLFVTGHSGYLRKILNWDEFFPQAWAQIQSERRILVMDLCLAARFTEGVNSDPNPHLSIASADTDELTWKALKDEGLSFVGAVFNHYFVEAFSISEADEDGDGWVSVQEAANYAKTKQRDFIHNEVFAVPEFLEGFHAYGLFPEQDPTFPNVIVDDTLGESVFLDLDFYR